MAEFKLGRLKFTWKGPWTAGTAYLRDDIVRKGGRAYVCIGGHTASTFEADYTALKWDLITDGQQWISTPWSVSTVYNQGDIVRYGGRVYITAVNHTSSSTLYGGFYDDQTAGKWNLFTEGTDWKGPWTVNTYYKVRDIVNYNANVYICNLAHTSAGTTIDGLEQDQSKWDVYTQGFKFRGDWVTSTRYVVNDVVKYGPSLYLCQTQHVSGINFSTTDFITFVSGLEFEDSWSAITAYQPGDFVTYGGYSYISKSINQAKIPPSEPADWDLFTTGFNPRGTYSPTVAYKVGDVVRYGGGSYVAKLEILAGQTPTDNPLKWERIVEGFRWRSDWADDQVYLVGDVVRYGSTSYICVTEHSSDDSTGLRPDLDDGSFWNTVAEGDESNVTTRRGDLITRNAIQNIRLPIGSAGQVLKVSGVDPVWDYFGEIQNVFYVALNGVDTPLAGKTLDFPFRTVKYALAQVTAQDAAPATVYIKTGVFVEEFPISIPAFTSIVGDEMRTTIIEPTPATRNLDKFLVRNNTTIRNMTWRGASGTLSAPDQYGLRKPTGGAWVALDPGTGPTDETVWIVSKSPYIQNVSTFGEFCVGMKVDGSLHNGGTVSMTANDFTQVLSDGIGAWITNQGRAELVSVFSYYGYMGYLAENGGIIRATNGNSSYGTYGTVSLGVDPTEISRTAKVDNRRLEALVSRVQTDGDKILYLEYQNAGQSYSSVTYSFTGTGNTSVISLSPNYYNGGVTSVRILADGASYKTVTANAQSGSNLTITLSASDTTVSNGYNGMRIILIDGNGVGQYGYIGSYDGGTKVAQIRKETFSQLTVSTASTSVYTVSSTSTIPVGTPIVFSGTAFGGVASGTIYYVVSDGFTATTFALSTTLAGAKEFPTTASSGTMTIDQAGWDTFVSGQVVSTSLDTTSRYTIEPRAIFTTGSGATATATKTTGIDTVSISSGGSKYITAPVVLIDGNESDTGGQAAEATSTISGSVEEVIVTSGGSGYASAPTITFVGGGLADGSANHAQATAVVSGAVSQVTLTSGGVGYTAPPSVSVSGGSGSGALITAKISDVVGSVTVNTNGNNYTQAPTVVFSGGSPEVSAQAIAVLNAQVTSVTMLEGGAGYVPASTIVTISGGGGSGATADAVIDFGAYVAGVTPGVITGITVTNQGSGYTTNPSVLITGVGEDASATANIRGQLAGVTVTNNGRGYVTAPVVSLNGGGGTGASATANITGSVTSLEIIEAGSGFTGIPTISFNGGGGTGATAVVNQIQDRLQAINVTNGGTGYTSNPAIAISGSGGTGAIARARISASVQSVAVTHPGRNHDATPIITFVSGGNYKSLLAGARYYTNASGLVAIGEEQVVETLAGIGHIATVANAVVNNTAPATTYQTSVSRVVAAGGYSVPAGITGAINTWIASIQYVIQNKSGYTKAKTLISLNKNFIRAEILQYINNTYPSPFTYNAALWRRDIQLITDAIMKDIVDGSLEYTTNVSINTAFTADKSSKLTQILAALTKMNSLMQTIIQNETVSALQNTITQVFDLEVLFEDGSATAISNCIQHVKNILSNNVSNNGFTDAVNLISSNRQYIVAEVLGYINTTYQDLIYNQALCGRDTKFIVDALKNDLIYAISSNASATASTTGTISTITVVNPGSGYSSGVTVSLSGGSPTTTATATAILNRVTGAFTGFRVTNFGKGYQTNPTVTITPDTGSGAFARCKIAGDNVTEISIINPGSGYTAGPQITIIDPNNTEDADFEVKVANGVLGQPTWTNRGVGFLSASVNVEGNGFSDIQQTGSYVYVKQLTNIPSPGANLQFDGDDTYYKLVTVREVVGPSGYVGARGLLLANKVFIQEEVVSYLDNFTYDNTKCRRDAGFLIDGIADDMVFGSNYRTLAQAYQYERGEYTTFANQRIQTAYSFDELETLALNAIGAASATASARVSNNIGFLTEYIRNQENFAALPVISIPDGGIDAQDDDGKDVLIANELFIRQMSVAYIKAAYPSMVFTESRWSKEVREIVYAMAYDLAYGGNSQVIQLAKSFWSNGVFTLPGSVVANKANYQAMLSYISDLLDDVSRNNVVTPLSGVTAIQNTSLPPADAATASRIGSNMAAYQGVIAGGPDASPPIVNPDVSLFSASLQLARSNLKTSKSAIQDDLIDYLDNTFVSFTYNRDTCYRDVGLIVQAAADDIYGDVAKSVESGQRYFASTAALVISQQLPQTAAAIDFTNEIAQKIIQNITVTRTQNRAFQEKVPSITNGIDAGPQISSSFRIIRRIIEIGTTLNDLKELLALNKNFIAAETVAYVNATYEYFTYNQELCARDIGYIIDAINYDIYGGLSRSREAGLRYYSSESGLVAITDQEVETLSAINYMRSLVLKIAKNEAISIKFQEAVPRVAGSIANILRYNLDDKIDDCIDELINIISNGPSALPPGLYTARLQVSPELSVNVSPLDGTSLTLRSKYSQVRLTGHDYLNIGTGNKTETNYPGIPINNPAQENEVVEYGGGRCFYTSTDQDGNFRVGELFRVEQATGIATLNADAFNLSGLNELSLGGVTLGGTGAVIREFSTDPTFFANSDSIVPTQKAIKTYIAAQLGSGGGNLAVNAITAGNVVITGNEIDTLDGDLLEIKVDTGVKITSTVASSSTNTGALIVAGGAAIGGNLYIGGLIQSGGGGGGINNTPIGNTTPSTGAFTTLTSSGVTNVTNATASTTTTNGAFTVTGGVGIGGAMNVGGITKVTSTQAASNTTSGALQVAGGVGVAGTIYATQFNGPVVGNVTGNVSGNVTGNIQGVVTGTAGSSIQDVTLNGTTAIVGTVTLNGGPIAGKQEFPYLGTNSMIRTNANSISENIVIPANTNGMSSGPVTIADGYTVTVNGDWSIV